MNKKMIILIVFILIVALGIGGYIVLNNSNKSKTQSSKSNMSQNTIQNNNNIDVVSNETENQNEVKKDETSDKKISIVYFSATGTTKKVAEFVKDETNADIFEIIPKQKYTSEDLNYGDSSTRATKEQNDENARPEIENNIDVSNYNVIFLGYPIWWGNVPKIILSFIDNSDLSGKTVIPFCTSGSSGIFTSESTLKSYNSNINWIAGNRFSSNTSKNEVSNWVKSLNY